MDVAVLTSLYPTPPRPREGIFAERRWRGMLARGHRVRVVQPLPRAPLMAALPGAPPRWRAIARAPEREERHGIPVARPRYLHVPGRARANARRFVAAGVRALLAGGRPDVVVADYAWPAALAAEALAERGLPLVVSGRGSDVLQVAEEPRLRELLADALRRAGAWCAVSQDLVAAMDRLAGEPGRGLLVPNGVDLELFRPRPRDAARDALGQARTGVLVLVVGHLIERKDPLLALAAFAAWRERAGSEAASARIAFVGEGPLREVLDERARALGEAVLLVGEADPEALAQWYAAADALLLTSRREGRPNVVLEALACGTPVLATAAGGTGELLAGLDGCLARTREPRELARALAALLARPPDARRLRAQVEPLSWAASLARLEDVLRAAIARGAR